jgi:hypothetical protein
MVEATGTKRIRSFVARRDDGYIEVIDVFATEDVINLKTESGHAVARSGQNEYLVTAGEQTYRLTSSDPEAV